MCLYFLATHRRMLVFLRCECVQHAYMQIIRMTRARPRLRAHICDVSELYVSTSISTVVVVSGRCAMRPRECQHINITFFRHQCAKLVARRFSRPAAATERRHVNETNGWQQQQQQQASSSLVCGVGGGLINQRAQILTRISRDERVPRFWRASSHPIRAIHFVTCSGGRVM